MKLDKRQFCTAVKNYQSMLQEERAIVDALDISPEWKGSDWINSYYELITDLCNLEEDPYVGTDLDWFCFETDFGRKEDYCRVYDEHTGNTWRITTPEVLYDFITRDY